MTFSIVARCTRTGQFGVALASSSPAVAARCAHARAFVGAVATQNVTDPRLGPAGLDMLQASHDASGAIDALRARAGEHAPWRQVTAISGIGPGAGFSGANALGRNGHRIAPDAVAAGNMLASDAVLPAMLDAFDADAAPPLAAPPLAAPPLAERLLRALEAALAHGGEEGPVHSAGLLVVDRQHWPLVDLRVDWHETAPIAALRALWTLWQPQMDAYVTRALNPVDAPSYGVPGDP